MKDVRRDNRVLSLVNKAGLRNQLTTMLDQLQRCQKSLNEFLEASRLLNLFLPVMSFVICTTHLLMLFGSLYCKQYGSDQIAPNKAV